MKFYSILEGETKTVLRRFLRLINKSTARIGTLESDLAALTARVKALEDAQSEEQGETQGES